MTDDQKIRFMRPKFIAISRKMTDRLHSADDCYQMAIIGFFKRKMPQDVSEIMVRRWIIDGKRSEYYLGAKKRRLDLLIDDVTEIENLPAPEPEEAESEAIDLCNQPFLNKRASQFMTEFYIRGKTYSEIAEENKVSEGTVTNTLYLSRKKIRENFQKLTCKSGYFSTL